MSSENGSRKMDLQCPFCKQKDVRRTRASGFLEESVFSLVRLRPYRCSLCRGRFYRFGIENGAKRPKRVRKKKKGSAKQDSQVPVQPDETELRELVAQIREAEQRLYGSPDPGSSDQVVPKKN